MRDFEKNKIIDATWKKYIPHANKLMEYYSTAPNKTRVDIRCCVGDAANALGGDSSRSSAISAFDSYETARKAIFNLCVNDCDDDDASSFKHSKGMRISILCIASLFADIEDKGCSLDDFVKKSKEKNGDE